MSEHQKVGGDGIAYSESIAGLNELGTLTVSLLQTLLNSRKIQFHTIEYRVKTEASSLKKISLKSDRYSSATDLTDLLGIRIITYFEDAVDEVSDLIEHEFFVDTANSVDKRANLESDRFGYLSRHYVLEMKDERCRLVEYSRFAEVRFEVQIRTILQHAWAEIEHDIGYKSDVALPKLLRRRFSRVASLLEVADAEFLALRREIERYGRSVRAEIDTSPQDLGIDQETVTELIRTSEVIRKLDSIIATRLHGLFLETVNPAVASAIVGYLKLLGYTDINQVQQTVSARKEQITEFAHVWVPLQDRVLGEEVPRGISLHYLFLISCAELPMDAAMAKMTKAEVGTSQIRRDSILRIKEALKRVRPPQE